MLAKQEFDKRGRYCRALHYSYPYFRKAFLSLDRPLAGVKHPLESRLWPWYLVFFSIFRSQFLDHQVGVLWSTNIATGTP